MAERFSFLLKLALYLAFIGLVFSCFQCKSDNKKDTLQEFYFPINELEEGLVYEFAPLDNQTSVDYWFMKSIDLDTAVYLTAQIYNEQFEVQQFSREEIVQNGVMQKANYIFETDSLGNQTRVDGQILAGNAFPFVADKNTVFLMKIKWVYNVEPESSVTLIRNRQYKGKTTYPYEGKDQECIKIGIHELLTSTENGDLEVQYFGEEIYAKNIGLVYYKKVLNDDFAIEYELKDRYPMAVFQDKFKTSLETN